MNETDKELRLGLINSWKEALAIAAMDLKSVELELHTEQVRREMLEGKLALHAARVEYASLALARLGVKAV